MLEFINSIPDSIGWMLVGIVGTVDVIMGFKVGKMIYEAVTDDDEEAAAD